mmetsp:Transcript_31158/g.56529  ORF Transcript_31158/g.56529 Transcript_31158/m.56529 type:complete len:104 (+) Transcript_31158:1282-1593(+)
MVRIRMREGQCDISQWNNSIFTTIELYHHETKPYTIQHSAVIRQLYFFPLCLFLFFLPFLLLSTFNVVIVKMKTFHLIDPQQGLECDYYLHWHSQDTSQRMFH